MGRSVVVEDKDEEDDKKEEEEGAGDTVGVARGGIPYSIIIAFFTSFAPWLSSLLARPGSQTSS